MSVLAPGQVWRRAVPFRKDVERDYLADYSRWVPGNRRVESGPDSDAWVSDGTGEERRIVVAVVALPKPYQSRVFYLRSWTDPEGNDFGNDKLRVCAVGAFTRWRNLGAEVAP